MIDLKEKPPAVLQLTDADFGKDREIVTAQEPVKLAVDALSLRSANLVAAEAAITFCLVQLQKQSS
jgi:hypothetical protein